MQFGDDILGGAVDDVRSALEKKKSWKREHHLHRLQDDGLMPLGHAFEPRRDPEEEGVDAYDRPPPGPPPDRQPARERERQRRPEEPEGGYDTAEEGVTTQPSSSILTTFSSGTSSTIADMGAGLVHGTAYLAGAAAGAVGKGLFRGITHLATGSGPIDQGGEEAAVSEADEPLRVFPRAKARGGRSMPSGGTPFPFPASYYIGDDDRSPPRQAPAAAAAAAAPVAAAAAAAPSRPSRPIAQRDIRLAQETMDSLPANDYGRGRRRAPGRGG